MPADRRTTPEIPFHRVCLTGRERVYVDQVLREGSIESDGLFTSRCGDLLTRQTGAKSVLMTPSCTAALEMAALLCDLHPGDEVIMPAFTFVSTATAFVRCGAQPVFVDIQPDTLNIDPQQVERAVTPRTRAIVAVHYAGVACDMDALRDIARRHDLILIEDAAHALGGSYRGQPLGSLGHMGCFSFHATKNYACGEGGALAVSDERFTQRAEILRDKGTNRRQFFRGEVDKYTWVDTGSSFVPSELSCAFLFAQLQSLEEIRRGRRERYDRYVEQLAPLAEEGRATLPHIPPECSSSYHLFHLLLPDADQRDDLIAHLRRRGIGSAFHYVPLHRSPMASRLHAAGARLPYTEQLSSRLIRLPLYNALTPHQQRQVGDCVLNRLRSRRPRSQGLAA
jgi:dTDP-4-amino-4,6-dideoxygalactose transaminase